VVPVSPLDSDVSDTATAPDVVELAGHLRFTIARLHRQLRQQDQSGLSPALGAALATISREGPLTLGQVAAHEQVAAPTVTRIVDKLVDRGFVTRQIDEGDRRVTLVRATAAGRRRLEAIRTRRTAWLASRLADLPLDDVERLAAAVGVLEGLAAPPTACAPATSDPSIAPTP
jgi:DNA-binding MarR family transcriptional regulator